MHERVVQVGAFALLVVVGGDTKESFVPANWATDRAPEQTAPAAETVAKMVTEAADDSTDAVGRRAA
eukprot:scaffold59947_cov73-Cyclotella_meneghiniana.AAC.2